MTATVRLATEADALYLSTRLRDADVLEIEAQGQDPETALLEGVRSPDPTYTAVREDGTPLLIFGTAPTSSPHLGSVWLLGSPCMKPHWIQILRETGSWIDRLGGKYRVLANVVHEENSVHIRWLKWAGFVFLRKLHHKGHNFYEFARPTRSRI